MMIAYVLVNVAPDTERNIIRKLEKKKRIKEMHELFGEWDLILKVETENTEELNFIVDEIRNLPEIKLTSTMIVAK